LKSLNVHVWDLSVISLNRRKGLLFYIDEVNAKYTISGLLCSIIFKRVGFPGIRKLFLGGRSSEDVYLTIEKTFGIKRKDLDSFIKVELKKYTGDSLK